MTQWSLEVSPRFEWTDRELMCAHDEALRHEAVFFAIVWITHMRSIKPLRVSFRRNGLLIEPQGYVVQQTGVDTAQSDQPYRGSLIFQSNLAGIPASACLAMALYREVLSSDGRSAHTTEGECSVSLLTIRQLASQTSGGGTAPFTISCDAVLRASTEVCNTRLILDVKKAYFSATVVETFDACMMPVVQAPLVQEFCGAGLLHMLPDQIGEKAALKPLIPVAERSLVPVINQISGQLPVQFFYVDQNHPSYPRPSEAYWETVSEQALWLRGYTKEQALEVFKRNYVSSQPDAQFNDLVSAFAKICTVRSNSMPYRPDLFFRRDDKGGGILTITTDFFRYPIFSGDCEDSAITNYRACEQFMHCSFKGELLQCFQTLGRGYVPFGALCNVTSPSLKHEEESEKDKKPATKEESPKKAAAADAPVPISEKECGMHKAAILIPYHTVVKNVGRTCGGEETAAKLQWHGKTNSGFMAEPPAWFAQHLKPLVLEGTGNLNGQLMPHSQYVNGLAGGDESSRRHIAMLKATQKLLKDVPALMQTFHCKPEFHQFNTAYEYDYDKLWSGETQQMSHFYVSAIALYTGRLMEVGQRYGQFEVVTQNAEGVWFKEAVFDAVVAEDERVAMLPGLPLTEELYKAGLMLVHGLEPAPYVDAHTAFAGPDAYLKALQRDVPWRRGGPDDWRSTADSGVVPVDLHVYNWHVEGVELAGKVHELKALLIARSEVKAIEFRTFNQGAGLTSGVLRVYVTQT